MKASDQLLAIIDANSSGVSGDKYLGALVNMGGRVESLRKVARVVAEYLPGTSRVEVELGKGGRGGIRGLLVRLIFEGKGRKVKGGWNLTPQEKCAESTGPRGAEA